jgi:hypothetical protein
MTLQLTAQAVALSVLTKVTELQIKWSFLTLKMEIFCVLYQPK